MVKISGIVYIIIGVAMAVFANYVHSRTDKASILLFFWIGLAFIAVGVFKVVIKIILKDVTAKSDFKKEAMDNLISKMNLNKDLAGVNMQQKTAQSPQAGQQGIISCPRCGTRHYTTSNFCHKCGQKLSNF